MTASTIGPQAALMLDAQVTWILDQLTSDGLPDLLERDVDFVLAVAADVRLDAIVEPADVTRVVNRLLATVPASTATSTVLAAWTDVIHAGPKERLTAEQLISRDHVEALITELIGLHPAVERALDRVADAPMLGIVASRFVGRIVGDVLAANRSVAEKIPGVGSMLSIGTSAASKVVGVADKQLQGLMGDTAAFAIRRLNKVVIDTMRDPMLADALLEVWDQNSGVPVDGVDEVMGRDDAQRIAGILQEVVIEAAPSPPVAAFVDAFVVAFFEIYGEYSVKTLLDELEINRDDLVAEAQVLVPRLIAAAHDAGRLEPLLRERLTPFFESDEVAAILAG